MSTRVECNKRQVAKAGIPARESRDAAPGPWRKSYLNTFNRIATYALASELGVSRKEAFTYICLLHDQAPASGVIVRAALAHVEAMLEWRVPTGKLFDALVKTEWLELTAEGARVTL